MDLSDEDSSNQNQSKQVEDCDSETEHSLMFDFENALDEEKIEALLAWDDSERETS